MKDETSARFSGEIEDRLLLRIGGRGGLAGIRGILWVWAALAFGLSGCAKVGDPIPPPVSAPDRVSDLFIYQQGPSTLTLSFTLPAGELRDVEILRECPGAELEVLRSLPVENLRPFGSGERSRAVDLDIQERIDCRYSVRARSRRGTRSTPSSGVDLRWTEAPACPEGLEVEVFPDHLLATWIPPSNSPVPVVAYLVDSRFVVNEPRYRIDDFVFGEPRSILVQSVSRQGNPTVVSGGCDVLRVTPEDTFPPSAPQGLRAVRVVDGVQLVWDALVVEDLAGYRIYRRDGGERRVVASQVTANQFLDRQAPVGAVVYYEVTALDTDGNEGPPSAEAAVPATP